MVVFCRTIPRHPRSTLFPYATLFRSNRLVMGFEREGTLIVSNGNVSAPSIVIGLANGDGTMNVVGGNVSASSNILVGVSASGTGTVSIVGGNVMVTNGVFGAGNDGTLTGGDGAGRVFVSNATLTVASLILGSTNGTGELTISTNGFVHILGGGRGNQMVVDGGTLQVDYSATPFAFENTNLNNRLVMGFEREG